MSEIVKDGLGQQAQLCARRAHSKKEKGGVNNPQDTCGYWPKVYGVCMDVCMTCKILAEENAQCKAGLQDLPYAPVQQLTLK